ncbi:uncharacterized protein LOC119635627 isoform X1 [Glossina fuscipes]|uniref:Uncharacterized protein LOC119635627 isoform X1 n=1 Tax=Glossina fuscipes TaxID=7396 RepID=A0A9C6DPN4_9MUSC|nr:uncharacterized protein LOC119635627 isoform X1 [Glossina fuscipes]
MNMKMHLFILITCLVYAAFSSPQFLTFKDGQVGVNFLGYHAQAGLGGGQNQNGLLGGLHASAGTPWGQNAAAGLGGNVNGRASGLLYAGAQSSPDVGASTVLAGDTSMGGFGGSEAHANGLVAGSSRSVSFNGNPQNVQQPPAMANDDANAIQRIRPPKKYQTQFTRPTISRNVPIGDTQRTQIQSFNDSSYVTKQRNKYRYRQRHPKRNEQRRRAYQNGVKTGKTIRSKSVYRTVEATQNTWPLAVHAQQQQKAHTERRQLIADTQPNVNSINTNANAQVSANTDFNTHSNANADADANANTNVKTVVRSRKVIQTQPSTTTGVNSNLGISYNAQANGDMVRSALQIPIGILQSLQQSLSGLSASKTVTVNKHISK